MASANVISTAPVPTPSYSFSGPPPPYTQTSALNNSASGLPGMKSPQTSRWSPKDEQEQKSAPRQSLPSIHEALGTDQPLQYAAPPPPPPTSVPQSYHSQPLSSPSEHARKSHTSEPSQQPPQHQQRAPRSPITDRPRSVAGQHSGSSVEAQRPHFSNQTASKLPTLHPLQTSRSPPMPSAPPPSNSSFSSYSQHPSPGYNSVPPPTPPSSHPGQFSYGYARPTQYAYPSAPPSSTYPPQQPSNYPGPDRYQAPWKSDGSDVLSRAEESKRTGTIRGPAFGESVKRHLEFFDFEASLNEVRLSPRADYDLECEANMAARSPKIAHTCKNLHELISNVLIKPRGVDRSLAHYLKLP